MTDPVLVLRKLALLREHLARAVRRCPDDVEVLKADVERQDALALSLLVSIQEAIDLAFHIVADEKWGVPASYADGFEMLATHGVVSRELATSMIGAAALRNRIAHGYATVDLERLWRELPAGLTALSAYADAVGEFAEKTAKT